MENKEEFGTESIWKLMLKMCLPAVFAILIMVIYNMADVFFIGQTGDAMKVTAISLTSPILTILIALGTMIGVGSCTAASISLGRNDKELVKNISSFCCYFSIGIGILFAVSVLVFIHPILDVIGTSENTREYARTYLTILALSSPVMIFNNAVSNFIRAEGAVKESMIGHILGSLINIILDPLLILSLNLGVTGAAIATAAGSLISCVYYLWYFHKKSPNFSIHIRYFSLQRKVAWFSISLGLSTGISTILSCFTEILQNNLLVSYGDNYVAALAIADKATMIIFMLQMGLCIGIQPVIAFNYGAGNKKRMNETIVKTAVVNLIIGITFSILCRVFGRTLVSTFINDPDIISLGTFIISVTTLTGPIVGLYELCTTFLQSTEKASFATLVSLLRQGILFIPSLFLMNALLGFTGIVYCSPITSVLAFIISLALCLIQYRRIVRLSIIT